MTIRILGVVQARTTSTRLPGKVLEPIGDRALIAWTVTALRSVPGINEVALATTTDPADDPLVAWAGSYGVPIHRGPVHDVLARFIGAARPFAPDLLIRQTADNPFVDPTVADRQIRLAIEERLDYVGIADWPIGIASEVARFSALEEAHAESQSPAEREHVMPFLYARPDRYRIGRLPADHPPVHHRYTVDTEEDLALAKEMAARIGHPPPVTLSELEAIVRADPSLTAINADVRQKPWWEYEEPIGDGEGGR